MPKLALPGVKGLCGPLSCLKPSALWDCLGRSVRRWPVMTKRCPTLGIACSLREADSVASASCSSAGRYAARDRKGAASVAQLGRLKEAGKVRPQQVSWPSATTSRWRWSVRNARDLLGANGITDENHGRHRCNLESVFTYEGTDHSHADRRRRHHRLFGVLGRLMASGKDPASGGLSVGDVGKLAGEDAGVLISLGQDLISPALRHRRRP